MKLILKNKKDLLLVIAIMRATVGIAIYTVSTRLQSLGIFSYLELDKNKKRLIMSFYNFRLLVNLKNIMIFSITTFIEDYDNPVVAYVMYEDLNRFPTWKELKKEQDS